MSRSTVRESAAVLAQAGNFTDACTLLKGVLLDYPEDEAVRRDLATLYRQRGLPDQAGRWGAAIPGWATDLELDRFARLAARDHADRHGIGELMVVTADSELSADAASVLELAIEYHRTAHRRAADAPDFDGIRLIAWGILLIVNLIGFVVIFFLTVFDVDTATQSARVFAVVSATATGLVLGALGVAATLEAKPARAVVWFVAALSLLVGSPVVAVLTGLTFSWER